MVSKRMPVLCALLYQTTGSSVAAPVNTPFTMKNGIKATTNANIARGYQINFCFMANTTIKEDKVQAENVYH